MIKVLHPKPASVLISVLLLFPELAEYNVCRLLTLSTYFV